MLLLLYYISSSCPLYYSCLELFLSMCKVPGDLKSSSGLSLFQFSLVWCDLHTNICSHMYSLHLWSWLFVNPFCCALTALSSLSLSSSPKSDLSLFFVILKCYCIFNALEKKDNTALSLLVCCLQMYWIFALKVSAMLPLKYFALPTIPSGPPLTRKLNYLGGNKKWIALFFQDRHIIFFFFKYNRIFDRKNGGIAAL